MEKPDLDLNECWVELGKNPEYIRKIIQIPEESEQRVEIAEMLLEGARKIARKLQAQYHPDRNPGDKNAERRFVRIARAIRCLELYTEGFRAKLQSEPSEASARDRIHFNI